MIFLRDFKAKLRDWSKISIIKERIYEFYRREKNDKRWFIAYRWHTQHRSVPRTTVPAVHVSKTFSINNPRVSHTHDAFFSRGLMRCRVEQTLLANSPLPRLLCNRESKVASPFLKARSARSIRWYFSPPSFIETRRDVLRWCNSMVEIEKFDWSLIMENMCMTIVSL